MTPALATSGGVDDARPRSARRGLAPARPALPARLLAPRLRGEHHRAGRRWSPTTSCWRCSRSRSWSCSSSARSSRAPTSRRACCNDLQRLFPAVELNTLNNALDRIRDSSTTIGVAAAIGAIWIGTSFWGAMDTAFCRIYHVECRGWLEQKRFALVMLLVVTLFLAASVVIPALEGVLVSSADDLPFGLSTRSTGSPARCSWSRRWRSRSLLCCVIYYLVPKGHVPWRGRLARGAVRHRDHRRSPTRSTPSTWRRSRASARSAGRSASSSSPWSGSTSSASSLMAGAVINALRYELRDTGEIAAGRRRLIEPGQAPASRSARRSPRAASAGRGGPAPCARCPERERITSDSVVAWPSSR